MTQRNGDGSLPRAGKARRGAGYPRRPTHFFHRYSRRLAWSCAANEIGADGCWLLTIIAAMEDLKRYQRAPDFFNEQLAPLCGWSVDKLARVRRRCVEHGWLHYESGGKRTPGVYWIEDTLIDGRTLREVESSFLPQSAEQSAEETARKQQAKRGDNRERSAEPPYLSCSLSPPPPPDDARAADKWAEVAVALERIGLADVAGTIAKARDRGYSPVEVTALIAHWKSRPGAWDGPGAIVWRIEHSAPGRPVTDGWPPENETHGTSEQASEQRRLQDQCSGLWSRLGQLARAELARQAGVDPEHVQGRTLAELPPEVRNVMIEHLQRDFETTGSTGKTEARVKPAPDCEAGEDVAAGDSRTMRREGRGTGHKPV